MSKRPKLKMFSEAEVKRYQDRMFRQHQSELIDARRDARAEGHREGFRDARNQMRVALGLGAEDRP